MIVVYARPTEHAVIEQVLAAFPTKMVTFRDPTQFHAYEADPLDQLVYCHDSDALVAQAYGRHPQVVVLSLDTTPLPLPPEDLIPFLDALPLVMAPEIPAPPRFAEREQGRGNARERILAAREARKHPAESVAPEMPAPRRGRPPAPRPMPTLGAEMPAPAEAPASEETTDHA